jgi:hypothetical protein
MSDLPAALKSPQDHVRALQNLALAGDLPGMLRCIGDLHARWDSLGALQPEVMKLEAIFLAMLNARIGNRT